MVPPVRYLYSQEDSLLGYCAVKSRRSLTDISEVLTASSHRPDDGGKKHLRNVGKLLRDYAAQYRRRLSSSNSPQ
jgi:hypothetical protein